MKSKILQLLYLFIILLVPALALAQSDSTIVYTTSNSDILLRYGGNSVPNTVISAGDFYIGIEGAGTQDRFGYLEFSNFGITIPSDAVIDSAYLRLYGVKQTTGTTVALDTLKFYASLRDVAGTDMTWDDYNKTDSLSWNTPGARGAGTDFTTDSSSYHYFPNIITSYDSVFIDVTSLMRLSFGQDSSRIYRGWIIQQVTPTNNSGHHFHKESGSYPPKLIVHYSSGSVAAPTGVTATDGDSTNIVNVTWNSVANVDSFAVYRATSEGGSYSLIATITDTVYNDTGAPVFNVNAPTTLSASQDSVQKIKLEWSGESIVSGDTVWYKIRSKTTEGDSSDFSNSNSGYRDDTIASASAKIYSSSTPGGTYSPIDSSQSTPYLHTGLSPDQTVYYRVGVKSTDGTWSAQSDSVMGNTASHYSITAIVLSQKDSSAIDSATVTITPEDTIQITNGSGQVVFGNLPESYTYKIKAEKSLFSADSINITLTSSLTDTIYLIPLPGNLTGVITDSLTGLSISNATVTVTPGSYSDNTESDGSFLISDIPPESSYTITITHNDYTTYNDTSIIITSSATNDIGTILLAASDSAGVIIDIDLTSGGTEKNLQFGFYPGASMGFDTSLNETELPPAPMSGAFFDARITDNDSLGNGSLIDIRNSSFDTLYFYIGFSRKDAADNITVEWGAIPDIGQKFTLVELMEGIPGETVNMLSNSSHTVTNPNVNKLKIVIGLTPLTSWHMNYSAGWNLASPGATYIDNSVQFAFPTSYTDTAYYFNSTYQSSGTLEAGIGYWINLESAYDSTRTAEVIDSLEISLSSGWNLIGTISDSADINTDLNLSSGEILGIYGSNGNEYVLITDYLTQGNGYWMNISSAATLIIKENAGLGKTSAIFFADDSRSNLKIPITINTEYGNDVIELHFGDYQDPTRINRRNDLPPVPPYKRIDARFILDNNYSLDKLYIDENLPFEANIAISTSAYNSRILLTWDNSKLDPGRYFLKHAMDRVIDDVDMAMTSELQIDGQNAEMLKFLYYSESIVPEAYNLFPNFPNPFNPETTLKYSIREAGKVRLTIFNILGQEVRTLVSDVKRAGIHLIRWDAKDNFGKRVAGGIYLSRLEVNGMSFTQKLVLIK